MVKGGPCLWWMKGAGQVLKADFIEGQSEDKAVLLFSSHPPPSARYPSISGKLVQSLLVEHVPAVLVLAIFRLVPFPGL